MKHQYQGIPTKREFLKKHPQPYDYNLKLKIVGYFLFNLGTPPPSKQVPVPPSRIPHYFTSSSEPQIPRNYLNKGLSIILLKLHNVQLINRITLSRIY